MPHAVTMPKGHDILEIGEKKGDAAMCTLFEELEARGRAREIIESGHDFGLSDADILDRLRAKLGLYVEQAGEYMEMYDRQIV